MISRICVETIVSMYRGNASNTRGTAFVVYEDIFDAKNAVSHLSGFNVKGRYLVALYYVKDKMGKAVSAKRKKADLDELKQKYGVDDKN